MTPPLLREVEPDLRERVDRQHEQLAGGTDCKGLGREIGDCVGIA